MVRSLLLFFLAYLASLVCSYFFEGSLILYLILWVGCGALFLLLRLAGIRLVFTVLALIFAAGFSYGEWREAIAPTNPLIAGGDYYLEGQVANRPVETDTSLRYDFKVESVDGKALYKPFKIRVYSEPGTEVAYGDSATLHGSTFDGGGVANPGQFDYDSFLKNQNILDSFSTLYGGKVTVTSQGGGNVLMKGAYFLRNKIDKSLAFLPEDQGALLTGIFFGDKTAMDRDTRTDLSRSGLMHAFAVSGLHVGYVVLFITMLLGALRIGGWPRVIILGIGLLLYSAMSGFTPSVVRASLMAIMLLIGVNMGREQEEFTALAAAAFLILLIEPKAMLQISFQLSFVAMLGILWFRPFFHRIFRKDFPGKDAIVIMLSAQIGIMPLLAYYFHTISFISFLISVVCCFIVGGIVILTLVALPFALITAVLGAIPLYAAGFLADIVNAIVNWGTELPWAYRYVATYPIWQMLLAYACLLIIPILPSWRHYNFLSLTSLVLVLFFLLMPATSHKTLDITFLAVGNGNAVAIKTPSQQSILLDAGGANIKQSTNIIESYLTSRGIDEIDVIINTHNDSDHSGVIPALLSFYPCKHLLLANSNIMDSIDLVQAATANNTAVTAVSRGDTIVLEDDITLEVLWPLDPATYDYSYRSDNDSSLITRLTYGDFSVIFSGDVGKGDLDMLSFITDDMDADILELPHHGSGNSYSIAYYERIAPENVVINVGKNSYGHPSADILQYWEGEQIPIYRTDKDGAVTITTNGTDYDIHTYLSP